MFGVHSQFPDRATYHISFFWFWLFLFSIHFLCFSKFYFFFVWDCLCSQLVINTCMKHYIIWQFFGFLQNISFILSLSVSISLFIYQQKSLSTHTVIWWWYINAQNKRKLMVYSNRANSKHPNTSRVREEVVETGTIIDWQRHLLIFVLNLFDWIGIMAFLLAWWFQ